MESNFFFNWLTSTPKTPSSHGVIKSNKGLDFLAPELLASIGNNLRLSNLAVFMQTNTRLYYVGVLCIIEKARSLGSTGDTYEDSKSYLRLLIPQKVNTIFSRIIAFFSKAEPAATEFYLPASTAVEKTTMLSELDKNEELEETLVASERTKQRMRDFFFHYLAVKLPHDAYEHFSLVPPPEGTGSGIDPFQTAGLLMAALSNEKELFMEIWTKCWAEFTDVEYEVIDVIPDIKDSEGNNLMHLAAFMGHRDLLKAIRNIDPASAQKCMLTTNSSNETPLDMALSRGHKDAVQYLTQNFSDHPFNPFSLLNYSFKLNRPNSLRKGIYLLTRQQSENSTGNQVLSLLAGEVTRPQAGMQTQHIWTGIRSLIRAGLNFKEANQTGYDFTTALGLDSTHLLFNYFESAEVASRLLNEKRFEELKPMLIDESSGSAVIDTVIGFCLQGHENALEFAGNGTIENTYSPDGFSTLISFFIEDFLFLHSDLDDADAVKKGLIEKWLPESQLRKTALINRAQESGLSKFAAYLVSLSREDRSV